jgi:ribosomal protein S18 acetylase RimI-like enzyme
VAHEPDPPVELRELRRSDLPSFERVIVQVFGRFEAATGLAESATAQIRSLRGPGLWAMITLLQALRIANVRFLVAVERGAVVGTTILSVSGNSGYIAGVATDAAARGRGIATRLMGLAETRTRAKGKPWLALDVESENETAIRVYRRIGYHEVARFHWFAGPPPRTNPASGRAAVEIPARTRAAADWANQRLPAPIREALPATARTLTHLELFSKPPRAKTKMWKITSGGTIQGMVRAHYAAATRRGFLLPIGVDPTTPEDALFALLAPAIDWERTLGATRIILGAPESAGLWTSMGPKLGLPYAVSTTLMVRPTLALPAP